MSTQKVANNPLGSYPVLVDPNTTGAEMQVVRLDVGTGTAESRVTSSNPFPNLIADVYAALKTIINYIARPIWTDPTTGRVNINNMTSLTTVTTVTTVTTAADVGRLNNLGATASTQQSALYVLLYGTERTNWALNVRGRIS